MQETWRCTQSKLVLLGVTDVQRAASAFSPQGTRMEFLRASTKL